MVIRVQRYPATGWPFDSLFDFADPFDGVFSDSEANGHWSPAIDVAEDRNESVVVAEVPGVAKEDLKISVHDGTLTIAGERKTNASPENASPLRTEIRSGKFSRAVGLPHEVNVNAISAELSNGVLRIVLPKADEAKPREIPVQ